MGKKVKTGKARKDKFYHLAKETGYRARSAFKLLQLNRKFEFLQKSRVCVDLCAAPGGWMQVAANQMPVSKLIIGVDLVPIKPIPGCMSFAEDITTDKCRQTLKKELNEWKVDVFLHDGAPNVGKNWIHDAYMQAQLTLSALKLSSEFLKKGGWFVTKVFRSKDYQSLMWVFNQLFSKVHATKPQASRNESAEIFVVCAGFYAPDKLDPKFLDPKFVFKDADQDCKQSQTLNLVHPEKVKKKAEGYADGDSTLFHQLMASQYIGADNYLELLAQCNEIVIDSPDVLNHPKTTNEVKECCKDIKVLGKKEIRGLITWHKLMKKFLAKLAEDRAEQANVMDTADAPEAEAEDGESDHEEQDKEEEKELSEKLAALKEEDQKEMRKKRKRVLKEKRKLRDKMSLNMIIPGDTIEQTDDIDIFNLKTISSKAELGKVEAQDIEDAGAELMDEEDAQETRQLMVKYDRHKTEAASTDAMGPESSEDEEDEEDEEMQFETDSEEEEDEKEEAGPVTMAAGKNPLVVDMEDQDALTQRKMDMWFTKDGFADLEAEEDEDFEIEDTLKQHKQKGRRVIGKPLLGAEYAADLAAAQAAEDSHKTAEEELDELMRGNYGKDFSDSDADSDDSSDSSDDEENDSNYDLSEVLTADQNGGSAGGDAVKSKKSKSEKATEKDGFEIVPTEEVGKKKKVRKLDPIGLAIGEEMIKSRKRRREIEEMSFHRYTFNDDHLPDWFSLEENRHIKKPLPVSKEQVDQYKERQRAIDARPIKKIAEAKARKAKKMSKKLERARKKAESITDTVDTSEKEKWSKIKEVYKRAGLTKKKKENVSYVVAKRGAGKRVGRPAGVKGRFRVVDPRMKKDDKARKSADKKKKSGKNKSSSNKTRRG